MEREQAVKFLKEEIRRLIEDEHVVDLFKTNCAEELAAVGCMTTKALADFLLAEGYISLNNEEIPEGGCVAIALWGVSSFAYNTQLVEDVDSFAHRLAKEGGQYGKNIAAQILDGVQIYNIAEEDFFSDEHAEEYDEKHKFETK